MPPDLSVLITAMEGRPYRMLADTIARQARPYGDRVEVLVEADSGTLPSGVKRQRLLDRAAGLFVAYVDDDNEVADDYLGTLLGAISERSFSTEVFTFDLRFIVPDGRPDERWKMCPLPPDRPAGVMPLSHLCAWRSDIARTVGWSPDLGYGDDQLWVGAIIVGMGGLPTWVHLPRVLYTYRFDPAQTANQTPARVEHARGYFGGGLRVFRHHRNGHIMVEAGVTPPIDPDYEPRYVRVIEPTGAVNTYRLSNLCLLGRVSLLGV